MHRQVLIPISSGGVGFIFAKTITLMAFLGSWALVTCVIAFRFLLDSCPFLLEAIRASNSGSLPFQAHLKLSKELPPFVVRKCLPPFEQFAKKGVDQLQEIILEKLDNHSFYSMGESTLGWNKNNTS